MVTEPAKEDLLQSYCEEELVDRAQRGDDEAFVELMRRTKRSSVRVACSILLDPFEAEDEVQNAYFNAWQYLNQFQGGAKFSTWLLRIVTNQCLMRLRKLRRARVISLDAVKANWRGHAFEVPDSHLSAEEGLRHEELLVGLRAQILKLPPLLRKALVLHDVDHLPMADVASRLGITTAAAKSRLCRARTELKKRMGYCSRAGGPI
jgi:RNA polymerase sigma-70 factor (ECF subfamily)